MPLRFDRLHKKHVIPFQGRFYVSCLGSDAHCGVSSDPCSLSKVRVFTRIRVSALLGDESGHGFVQGPDGKGGDYSDIDLRFSVDFLNEARKVKERRRLSHNGNQPVLLHAPRHLRDRQR